MDFPSPSLCQLIVQRNRRGLDPCRPVLRLSGIQNPGYDIHGVLENLQSELMAAATRADAAAGLLAEQTETGASGSDSKTLSISQEDFHGHIAWLSCVLSRLVVERAKVETSDPAVDASRDVQAHVRHPGFAQHIPNRSSSTPDLQSLKSFDMEDDVENANDSPDSPSEVLDGSESLLTKRLAVDATDPDSPNDYGGSLQVDQVHLMSSSAAVAIPKRVVQRSMLRKFGVKLGSALIARCTKQSIR